MDVIQETVVAQPPFFYSAKPLGLSHNCHLRLLNLSRQQAILAHVKQGHSVLVEKVDEIQQAG
jgi:hypothetical protein